MDPCGAGSRPAGCCGAGRWHGAQSDPRLRRARRVALGSSALSAGGADPWQNAAARANYPVYRPTATLGFRLAHVDFQQCGYGNASVDALYTRGSGTRRAVVALTEAYPHFCGDPGESMTVTTVDVNGASVPVNVFCYSPGPDCTVEDGFGNGYLLYLSTPGAKPTRIAVTSRYVTLDDVMTAVRSLEKVPRPPPAPAPVMSVLAPARRRRHGESSNGSASARQAIPTCRTPSPRCSAGRSPALGARRWPHRSRSRVVAEQPAGRLPSHRWDLAARLTRNNGAVLDAVGSGIRETHFVLRPGDAHCFPTGGTRSRTWRWNGTRFTSGAWKQSKPASPGTLSISPPSGYLKTPSGNIVCVPVAR